MVRTEEVTVYDAAANEGIFAFAKRQAREISTFRYAVSILVLNNLRSRYRKSVLGFAWSLLNPLLTMAVIALIFSAIFQQDLRKFGLYIFSGILPWGFISNALASGTNAIVLGEGFLRKLKISKGVFPLVAVTAEGINFLFSLVSLLLLALLIQAPANFTLLALPLAMVVTYLFAAGLALIVSVANVYFRDLPYVVGVGLTLWFYTVPILYPMALVPPPLKQVMAFNPLFYYISLFQSLIYDGVMPSWSVWGLCLAFASAALLAGLLLLKSKENDLVFRL